MTHIVEEGRFGGLSAYMYALHGFDVTSIEFLPLESVKSPIPSSPPSSPIYMSHLTLPPRARRVSHAPSHVIVSSQVSNALRKMAPRVKLLTGDGSQLVPEVLNRLAPDERERTMVIFDGEKRFRAWSTWEKVRDKAAMAIFDDSNIGKEGKQVESRTFPPPIVPICHARSFPRCISGSFPTCISGSFPTCIGGSVLYSVLFSI